MNQYAFSVTEQWKGNRTMILTYVRMGVYLTMDMSVYTAGEKGIEKRTVMNVNMIVKLKNEN